jgi:signal transduction histidine kinase
VVLELQLEARHLRATLAAVRDEAAHVLGVVVLFTDISDAKALEHMKTLFVSMVAHEIKAPLGAVEGYLNLILAGDLDRDPERRQQVVTRCLARTGALLALVQDLLEITRRDSGRLEKRLEPVDLVALVDELVQFHGRDAAARQITLTREAPAALPRPVADRNDLERVLTNLLSNAVKYNRDGGRVTVRLASTGGAVTIEVADTGIGMSEAERARLGEEFYRAKNARTRLITGTGLGVALVKKILDSYNGALEIASVPGEGSTFRVLLPAPGAPAAVTDGAGARPGGAAAGRDHAGPG